MPMYPDLKVRQDDKPAEREWKERAARRLLDLRAALAAHFRACGNPGQGGVTGTGKGSIRLATWNIREFDSTKFGPRLTESHHYIAEILSHFDLIAVQEVREDLKDLRRVMRLLGRGWNYVATDVTEGTAGNRERMVFVYDTSKVRFRNIAGELVLTKAGGIVSPHDVRLKFKQGLDVELPEGDSLPASVKAKTYTHSRRIRLEQELRVKLPEGSWVRLGRGAELVLPEKREVALDADGKVVLPTGDAFTVDGESHVKLPKSTFSGGALQFARTPFLVAFQAGWLKLNLCTVHILYGKGKVGMRRRIEEIRKLTKFLSERAEKDTDSDSESFFVVLGDFNIEGKDHETMDALESNDFEVPDAIKEIPGSNVAKNKAYDQIAYWTDPDGIAAAAGRTSEIKVLCAGVFDYFETVFREGAADVDGKDEAAYTPIMRAQQGDPGGSEPWEYKEWRTYQMSDHLPMWVELQIDFGKKYLEGLVAAAEDA